MQQVLEQMYLAKPFVYASVWAYVWSRANGNGISEVLVQDIIDRSMVSRTTLHRVLHSITDFDKNIELTVTKKIIIVNFNLQNKKTSTVEQIEDNPLQDVQEHEKRIEFEYRLLIDYFNILCGTSVTKSTKTFEFDLVKSLYTQGYSTEELKAVAQYKYHEWHKQPKMIRNIRPATLYGDKFGSYFNEYKKSGTSELNLHMHIASSVSTKEDRIQKTKSGIRDIIENTQQSNEQQ